MSSITNNLGEKLWAGTILGLVGVGLGFMFVSPIVCFLVVGWESRVPDQAEIDNWNLCQNTVTVLSGFVGFAMGVYSERNR